MKIRIVPLTQDLLPAVRAFNARLGPNAPFFLPEKGPSKQSIAGLESPAISWTHYVAMDNSETRGGFLLMDQPAWINREVRRASNYQSILSEGIRDNRYSSVAVHMLRHIEQASPYSFALGMGNEENPLPRLLKASGWTLRRVPFLFRVRKVRNFLREMRLFRQHGYSRMATRAASMSGLGWIGTRLLQARPSFRLRSTRGLNVDCVTSWGPWVDGIWERYQTQCSFAVLRDRTTLDLLYPLGKERLMASVVCKGSAPIGWATWLNTPMKDDRNFGNLRVVTILDCAAVPDSVDAFAQLITRHLDELDADILITNQGHFLWITAFRKAGFLPASSNYLLATSKKLSRAIEAGGGEERIHLTRGDGDGRIHL